MNDQIGKYTIVRRLAIGGTAEAYLATRDEMEGVTREVVVKSLLPHLARDKDFIEVFLDEAKSVAKLSHPNILNVLEVGWEEDRCYLVMEYIPSVDLDVAIEHTRGLEPAVALKIASEICAGLAYAHSLEDDSGRLLGIIHSDISPNNILLGLDGAVKVYDFGIAKAVALSQKMHPGSYEGRNHYIAPEQALGDDIDHRTDIHAVGVLLWEMLTGEVLFKRKSLFKTIEAVINESPPSVTEAVPSLSPEIDEIIATATAKDPNERFQSCSEFQLAIDKYISDTGLHSTVLALGRYIEQHCDPDGEGLNAPRSSEIPDPAPRSSEIPDPAPRSSEFPDPAPRSSELTDLEDQSDPRSGEFSDAMTTVEGGRYVVEPPFQDGMDEASVTLETRRYQRTHKGLDTGTSDSGSSVNLLVAAQPTVSLKRRPTPTPPPEPIGEPPATTMKQVPSQPPPAAPSTGTPLPIPSSATPLPTPRECEDNVNDEHCVTSRHPSRPAPSVESDDDMFVPPTAVVMLDEAQRESIARGPRTEQGPRTEPVPRTSIANLDDHEWRIVEPAGGVPDRVGVGAIHAEKTIPYPVSVADLTIEGRYSIVARRKRTALYAVLVAIALALMAVGVLSLVGVIDVIGGLTSLANIISP